MVHKDTQQMFGMYGTSRVLVFSLPCHYPSFFFVSHRRTTHLESKRARINAYWVVVAKAEDKKKVVKKEEKEDTESESNSSSSSSDSASSSRSGCALPPPPSPLRNDQACVLFLCISGAPCRRVVTRWSKSTHRRTQRRQRRKRKQRWFVFVCTPVPLTPCPNLLHTLLYTPCRRNNRCRQRRSRRSRS